jgi:hypothetical protein
MVVNIVLGIRVSPNSFQRVTLRNVSLDSKVEHLKLEASKTVNLSRHFIGNFEKSCRYNAVACCDVSNHMYFLLETALM